MMISPSGTRRVMVAQSFMDQSSQGEPGGMSTGLDMTGVGSESIDALKPQQLEQEVEHVQREEATPTPGSSESDLADYIFKKLESFGYLGRRLMEFRNKFVKKTISGDGNKQVEITMPSTYFGKNKEISDHDVRSMIKEIQHKFNLFFESAESSDGKMTIKFTSAKSGPEDGKENVEDELSKVYGHPGGKSEPEVHQRTAETLKEMIKKNKDKNIESLIRMAHKYMEKTKNATT